MSPSILRSHALGMSILGLSKIKIQASRWGMTREVSSIRISLPMGSISYGINFQRKGGMFLSKTHLGHESAKTSSQIASGVHPRARKDVFPTAQYYFFKTSDCIS